MPTAPIHRPMTVLGTALRARRGEQSQREAAAEIGLTQPTFTRLERGSHTPSYPTAVALARWLGWTVEQVMEAAEQEVGIDA